MPSFRDCACETDAAIYRISHDLGAAIRSLTHLSGWVAEDINAAGYDLPEDTCGTIALLQQRGNRLQTMLKDLLTYSVVGQGGLPFDGDPHRLLTDISTEISGHANFQIIASGHTAPKIDAADLRHVLTALLSNAMKHHDTGTGKIWVAFHAGAVSVTDDGSGIPEDQWRNACGIMTTLQPRDAIEGSGMGLAICSKIATHYGGRIIMMKPDNGRGCCVRLQFDDT